MTIALAQISNWSLLGTAWPREILRRAGLVFDPYKAYGGAIAGAEELSYVDIIINPLLAALNEVLTRDTKVFDLVATISPSSCSLCMEWLGLQCSLRHGSKAADSHCGHIAETYGLHPCWFAR